ncbi:MAG: hypothetical protein B7Y45_02405 [Sphingomonas sp. 28-66-16]|nr:MAG: hypothetical protein B7Y45_02405 [Sphingomonas sp. 28-66-16]
MNPNSLPAALIVGLLASLTTSGCTQQRKTSQVEKLTPQTKAIGGLTFYYGIVKGAIASKDMGAPSNASMQMPQPQSPNSYHIVLAVFETRSKTRIKNASVAVRLGGSSARTSGWLPMEFMSSAGIQSYGRYAQLPSPGRYPIEFRVTRSSTATPVTAHFVYERP